jgi:hypothetical protein
VLLFHLTNSYRNIRFKKIVIETEVRVTKDNALRIQSSTCMLLCRSFHSNHSNHSDNFSWLNKRQKVTAPTTLKSIYNSDLCSYRVIVFSSFSSSSSSSSVNVHHVEEAADRLVRLRETLGTAQRILGTAQRFCGGAPFYMSGGVYAFAHEIFF